MNDDCIKGLQTKYQDIENSFNTSLKLFQTTIENDKKETDEKVNSVVNKLRRERADLVLNKIFIFYFKKLDEFVKRICNFDTNSKKTLRKLWNSNTEFHKNYYNHDRDVFNSYNDAQQCNRRKHTIKSIKES